MLAINAAILELSGHERENSVQVDMDEDEKESEEAPQNSDRIGYTYPDPPTLEAYENKDYVLIPHEWPLFIKAY